MILVTYDSLENENFFRHIPKAGGTSVVLSECAGVIVVTTYDHRRMSSNVPNRRGGILSIVHQISKNPQLIGLLWKGLDRFQIDVQVGNDQDLHEG